MTKNMIKFISSLGATIIYQAAKCFVSLGEPPLRLLASRKGRDLWIGGGEVG